jgi:hypothetical protein
MSVKYLPYYLHSFHTNYIIFTNVGIFIIVFSNNKFLGKENVEIFRNILFVKKKHEIFEFN